MVKKDKREMFKSMKKSNNNSLTQMDFFVDVDAEDDDEANANMSDNLVTPSGSSKKRKQGRDGCQIEHDSQSYTKETVLVTSVDYMQRGKLTTIPSYEKHYYDKDYINMMHTYLCHKLRTIQDNINRAVASMEGDGHGKWDPTFLEYAKDFSNKCLEKACENIIGYDRIVIHALSGTAINVVLNLGDFAKWGKYVNAIAKQMCKSYKFSFTIVPMISEVFYFRISFDDNTPMALFLEKQFEDW